MKINIARFYRQERLKLDCEVVTPLFLGGADQEAETWRALGNCLAEIAGRITTSRDGELVDGRYFGHLKDRAAECSEIEAPPPFRPCCTASPKRRRPSAGTSPPTASRRCAGAWNTAWSSRA
ncbi:hypothetical protein [Desulfolithobacter sp.]